MDKPRQSTHWVNEIVSGGQPRGTNDVMDIQKVEELGPEDEDEDSEETSLLPRWRRTSSMDRRCTIYQQGGFHRKYPSSFAVTVAASALILTFDLAMSAPMAPRMAIFEDIICHNHYQTPHRQPLEMDCKIQAVQNELVLITNWQETFDSIPSVVASIPYGALADRIGREKILILALVGCILSDCWVALVCWQPNTLPLRAVWMSGLFQLFGGGGAVVMSMLHTMIGDVCSPTQRTAAFSKAHAAILIAELVSIPLAANLMTASPWVPILGALGMLALAVLAICGLSLFYAPPHCKHALSRRGSNISPMSSSLSSVGQGRWVSRSVNRLRNASAWITGNVICMLIAFFCCQLGRNYSSILLQYATIKFNWDYAKASYLLVLRAAGNLIILFTALPYLSSALARQRLMDENQINKHITVLSGVCLVVGSLLIFLSANAFVAVLGQIFVALGSAFSVTARSLLTEMVGPQNISVAYTSVTTVTYVAVIVGGPVLAALFQWGMSLGPFWIGLPFAATAIMFGISTIMIASVGIYRWFPSSNH